MTEIPKLELVEITEQMWTAHKGYINIQLPDGMEPWAATDLIDAVNMFPALAAEIKRLEAALDAEEDRSIELDQYLDIVKEREAKALARIAVLEAALGLPEGCDVFQLERAMKEGARTENGMIIKFQRMTVDGTGWAVFDCEQVSLPWLVDPSTGKRTDGMRLYCIKEAK